MAETEDERVKRLTRTHDIVNVFLIAALTAMTVWAYAFLDVHGDSLRQRKEAMDAPHPVYTYLSAGAGFYAVYDLLYIIAGKAYQRVERRMGSRSSCCRQKLSPATAAPTPVFLGCVGAAESSWPCCHASNM